MADTLLNDYRQKAHVIGDAIIAWARPEGWPEGPTSVLQTCSKIFLILMAEHFSEFSNGHLLSSKMR